MAISEIILQQVNQTPFVDTHEHLFEESKRLAVLDPGFTDDPRVGAPDFGLLFRNYAHSDLESSGMKRESIDRLFEFKISPKDKWKLLEPWYRKTLHTGYMQAIRETVRLLYDEDDLRADNVQFILNSIRDTIQHGYYKTILQETSGVEYAQVHSLDAPVFMETQNPELLCQDILFEELSTDLDLEAVIDPNEAKVCSLNDFYDVIDRKFAECGPRAIAVNLTLQWSLQGKQRHCLHDS